MSLNPNGNLSLVTFLLAISGAISQYPIGNLSDKYDRRLVIIYSTFGASLFALLSIFTPLLFQCLLLTSYHGVQRVRI